MLRWASGWNAKSRVPTVHAPTILQSLISLSEQTFLLQTGKVGTKALIKRPIPSKRATFFFLITFRKQNPASVFQFQSFMVRPREVNPITIRNSKLSFLQSLSHGPLDHVRTIPSRSLLLCLRLILNETWRSSCKYSYSNTNPQTSTKSLSDGHDHRRLMQPSRALLKQAYVRYS